MPQAFSKKYSRPPITLSEISGISMLMFGTAVHVGQLNAQLGLRGDLRNALPGQEAFSPSRFSPVSLRHQHFGGGFGHRNDRLEQVRSSSRIYLRPIECGRPSA